MVSNLAESFTDQHREKSRRPLAAIADKQLLGKPNSHWTSETNMSARVAVQNPHWSPPPPLVGSFSPSSRAHLKPQNDLAAIAPSLSYSLSAPRSRCSSSDNSPPQTTHYTRSRLRDVIRRRLCAHQYVLNDSSYPLLNLIPLCKTYDQSTVPALYTPSCDTGLLSGPHCYTSLPFISLHLRPLPLLFLTPYPRASSPSSCLIFFSVPYKTSLNPLPFLYVSALQSLRVNLSHQ